MRCTSLSPHPTPLLALLLSSRRSIIVSQRMRLILCACAYFFATGFDSTRTGMGLNRCLPAPPPARGRRLCACINIPFLRTDGVFPDRNNTMLRSLAPLLLLGAAGFLCCCRADIPADVITSLPGWSGPLPTKQYSGYIDISDTKHMHYW